MPAFLSIWTTSWNCLKWASNSLWICDFVINIYNINQVSICFRGFLCWIMVSIYIKFRVLISRLCGSTPVFGVKWIYSDNNCPV